MNSGNNLQIAPGDVDLGPSSWRPMVGGGLISPDIFGQIVNGPLPVPDDGTDPPGATGAAEN